MLSKRITLPVSMACVACAFAGQLQAFQLGELQQSASYQATVEVLYGKAGALIKPLRDGTLQMFDNTGIWSEFPQPGEPAIVFHTNLAPLLSPARLEVDVRPNGSLRLLALFGDDQIELPTGDLEHFNQFAQLKQANERYQLQLAEHDFDNDGHPELMVAIGDGLVDLAVMVFSYHPADSLRTQSWTLDGSFYGQEHVFVEQDRLIMPIGSQGLYEQYNWANGRFNKVQSE